MAKNEEMWQLPKLGKDPLFRNDSSPFCMHYTHTSTLELIGVRKVNKWNKIQPTTLNNGEHRGKTAMICMASPWKVYVVSKGVAFTYLQFGTYITWSIASIV